MKQEEAVWSQEPGMTYNNWYDNDDENEDCAAVFADTNQGADYGVKTF